MEFFILFALLYLFFGGLYLCLSKNKYIAVITMIAIPVVCYKGCSLVLFPSAVFSLGMSSMVACLLIIHAVEHPRKDERVCTSIS